MMQNLQRWRTAAARRLVLMILVIAASLPAMAEEETYTVNFKDADIKELIKFVADVTGYTVIMDPRVRANIQVISKDPVNEQELYDLFLTVLSTHGYAAVRTGNVLRIVSDKTVRTNPVPVTSDRRRANSEFITHVMELENISATKLIPVLRPLVPQEGHMAAYSDTNAIIISDTSENVEKLMKIIARLDKSSTLETEVVKLQHASAEETVRIIEQVIKQQGGSENNAGEDRVNLVADPRSNSILVSGTGQARVKALALIAELDTALEKVGNAQVMYLNHAKAKDLAPVLAKVSQNLGRLGATQAAAKGGAASGNNASSIEADESTNSLIITAPSEVMEGLRAIIDQLDVPRAQVLVEAIIVEVTQGDQKDLGMDWLVADQQGGFGGSNQSNGLIGSVAAGAFDDDEEDALTGLAAALAGIPGAVWGGADFDVGGTSFAAIITALETTGETNILSTPSLMTLDNNEATIVVGQEVPFVTGSYTSTSSDGSSSNPGNPFQTINRKNVGITLKVTPHVNEGGQISLEIMQEVSGLAATEQSTVDVVTNERRIETTVNTKDGETVVLGGLIQDDVNEVVSQVPILGDLPLIGRLFKKTRTTVNKKNLMVFLRPTVIRDSAKSMELSRREYQRLQHLQRYKRARGVDLFDEDVLPMLPDWEKELREARELQQKSRPEQPDSEQSQAVPAAEQTDGTP